MKRIPKVVGYVISDSKGTCFKDIEIMRTHRGWWRDASKLWKIMDACLEGKSLKDALTAADITKKEWRIFAAIHPNFVNARRSCKDMFRRINYPPSDYNILGLPILDLSSPPIDLGDDQSQPPK